jgi:ElaA protein
MDVGLFGLMAQISYFCAMIHFSCKFFHELTPLEVYEIMRIRSEVFVVEQNCVYLDADGKDPDCWHLMGRNEEGTLVCYTRLLPEGLAYPQYVSIGRVISSPLARGTGAGKLLMEESIRQCMALFGPTPIKIGAQSYLLRFYESFGFQSTGEEYLEDGIPHTKMIRH